MPAFIGTESIFCCQTQTKLTHLLSSHSPAAVAPQQPHMPSFIALLLAAVVDSTNLPIRAIFYEAILQEVQLKRIVYMNIRDSLPCSTHRQEVPPLGARSDGLRGIWQQCRLREGLPWMCQKPMHMHCHSAACSGLHMHRRAARS